MLGGRQVGKGAAGNGPVQGAQPLPQSAPPRPGVSRPSSGGPRDRQPVPAAHLPVRPGLPAARRSARPPVPSCRALAPASLAAEGFRKEKALLPVPALNYHQLA